MKKMVLSLILQHGITSLEHVYITFLTQNSRMGTLISLVSAHILIQPYSELVSNENALRQFSTHLQVYISRQ